ncbi:MAG: hypothetical protein NZM29_04185 [Nitrospira sp.]|nr:hypothetical protein [Nitrospira sp.]
MSWRRDGEEADWLGGETLVRPYPQEQRAPLLRGLMAGLLVLLTSVGFRQFVKSSHPQKRRYSSQRDDLLDNAKIQTSKRNPSVIDMAVIGAAFGIGMVAGIAATFMAATQPDGSVHVRRKGKASPNAKEFEKMMEVKKRD